MLLELIYARKNGEFISLFAYVIAQETRKSFQKRNLTIRSSVICFSAKLWLQVPRTVQEVV